MRIYKLLVAILCIIAVFSLPSYSKVKSKTFKSPAKVNNTGYTVNTAKAKAFENVKMNLPLIHFRSDLTDKNYDVNISYISKNMNSNAEQTRFLFPSFIGQTLVSYGVRYADRLDRVFHFNSQGKLLRIEIDNNNPQIYPKRTITYNSKGNLHTIVLYISDREQYNFDGKGNLIVHWIGERGFNRSGQLLKIKRTL